MSPAAIGLAFFAGVFSILSPCVLPLLPIVLGSAASEHRFGPLALAVGVTLSFLAIGLFVATVGFTLGLDDRIFRNVAAYLMIALGIVLAIPPLQARLAAAGGPVGDWVDRKFGGLDTHGLFGQFGGGLLLGAVWSPCVGPTLGAAVVLAAQGRSLGMVAATMVSFGLGAGLPLAFLGALSRKAMVAWRDRLLAGGKGAKAAFGVILVLLGLLVVTGRDRSIETALVNASPQWLTELTTRF